jgi:hypothetical protein
VVGGFFMMEPTDSDLGYRLDFWCLYFSRFILEFNNIIVSIVDDVSISSKTFVVTSFKELKIKIYRLSLSLLKVCCKVCIRVRKDECLCLYFNSKN